MSRSVPRVSPAQLSLFAEEPPAALPNPAQELPDVRDGLTRTERVVLWQLHELQKRWGDRRVPTATLYGYVVDAGVNISPRELENLLVRFGGTNEDRRRQRD